MPSWHLGVAAHGEVGVAVHQIVRGVASLVTGGHLNWLRMQQTRDRGFHRGGFESGNPEGRIVSTFGSRYRTDIPTYLG